MNAMLRARRRPSAGLSAGLVAILFAVGGTLARPPAAAAFLESQIPLNSLL